MRGMGLTPPKIDPPNSGETIDGCTKCESTPDCEIDMEIEHLASVIDTAGVGGELSIYENIASFSPL